MSVEQLITEHLDIWTGADTEKKSGRGRSSGSAGSVYGVKKLRELILELAVRGKLVPQDESDEPASELLKRIQSENAKLIAEGKIKKDKLFPKITEGEKPFKLPLNWEWTRLGSLFDVVYGKGLANTELTEEGYEVFGANGIIGHYSSYLYSESQLLVSCRGAYSGKPNISPPLCFITSNTLVLQNTWKCLDLKFFFYSLTIADKEKIVTGSAQPQVTTTNIDPFLVVLPPLAEQQRIVAKVDELMALCDQLENQHNDAAEAHEKLVTHLLGTLTQSQNAIDFNTNWQRISEHFDTLFTTEASIDALKQTLLQLAVMGKLVPQYPNDEPVTNLFNRIKESEALRVKNKEIQKPKKITTNSLPGISIPKPWIFKTLSELAFVTKLAGFEYTEYINLKDEGEVPVIRAQNVRPFLPKTENLKFIDLNTSLDLPRSALDRPSLLVTFIGAGIGDVCLFSDTRRWHLAPNVAKVEPFADLNLEYLTIFMNSPEGRKEIFKSMKSTAQPSLSMGTIREIWIPTPPSPEQQRIVIKVHELMTICDQLKAGITSANQLQQKLADVMIEQSINVNNDA